MSTAVGPSGCGHTGKAREIRKLPPEGTEEQSTQFTRLWDILQP